MSKIKKRVWGVVGLLAVVAMTITAAIMPAIGAYAAASDIIISVEVIGGDFSTTFVNPTGNANLVNSAGTAGVKYANADSLIVEMTDPLGATTVVFNDPLGGSSGYIDFLYNLDAGYGEYIFQITGKDLHGNSKVGDEIIVHYHSANFEITNPDDPADPAVKVNFGSEVCGVSFQLFSLNPGDDPSVPLLDPPYTLIGDDFTSLSGFASGTVFVTIPLSKPPYNLAPGLYRTVMTTYDCSSEHETLEDDLEMLGGGNYFYNPKGDAVPPKIPDAGLIKIGGLTITRADFLIGGGFIILVAIIAYFYLRSRRKIQL